MAVNVLVITGYGTNSHRETAHAARLAGADRADCVHFADIVARKTRLEDYQWLIFPGGFLDGDDLGAAQAAAQRWRHMQDADAVALMQRLQDFLAAGKLVLGICNGFQLMVKLGIVPALGGRYFERQVSLAHNASARYEDRWVSLAVNSASPCVFTKGLSRLCLPVRHGEGRLVPKDAQTLQALVDGGFVALSYAHPETGTVTEEYPYNPNQSPLGIAGLTDPSGRILGLMPHPEAFHHPTNHPFWTREKPGTPGTALFENAVRYLRDNAV